MSVPVRLLKRAIAQAYKADEWWRENRKEAPMLFVEELSGAMDLLRNTPDIGTPFLHPKRKDIRRLILPRTRYHLSTRRSPQDAGVKEAPRTARTPRAKWGGKSSLTLPRPAHEWAGYPYEAPSFVGLKF